MIKKIPFYQRLKIRQSAPILGGLTIILILLITAGYNFASKQIITTAEGQMTQFSSSINRQDDYNIQWIRRSLPPLEEAVAYLLSLPKNKQKEVEDSIIHSISNARGKQLVEITTIEGNYLQTRVYSSDGIVSETIKNKSKLNLAVENLQATSEESDFKIDIDDSRTQYMRFSSYLKDEMNETYATITVSLSLAWYAERINSFSFFETCIPFFITKDKKWTLPESADTQLDFIKDELLENTRGNISVTYNGINYVCLYMPSVNDNFKIGVLIPTNELLGDLNTTTVILSIVGLLILFSTAYILNRTYENLISPLGPLSILVKKLAKGSLESSENLSPAEFSAHSGVEEKLRNATYQLSSALKQRIYDLTLMAKTRGRILGELALAREIQENLKPKTLPSHPNIEIATLMHTSKEVYGDIFDCAMLSPNKIFCIIGNVAEHGIPGAILSGKVVPLLYELLHSGYSPAETLEKVNTAYTVVEGGPSSFISVFVCILDIDSGELSYASAGQLPPYLINSHGISFITPTWSQNPPLGITQKTKYVERTLLLSSHDKILFVSPRFLAIQDAQQNFYGEEKLSSFFDKNYTENKSKNIDLNNLLQQLLRDAEDYAGEKIQDDVMLFALDWKNSFESSQA